MVVVVVVVLIVAVREKKFLKYTNSLPVEAHVAGQHYGDTGL